MERSVFPPVKRIIAIGDVHGDFKALQRVLRLAKVINSEGHWIGRSTYLVQLGDQVDSLCRDNTCSLKDPEELRILLYLNQLDQEARRSRGRVISLLGNHEYMNMVGDQRYASKVDVAVMGGARNRAKLFEPGGQLTRVLAKTRYGVVKIGGWVFVHGGILPRHARKYSIDQMNNMIKRFMSGDKHIMNHPAFKEVYDHPQGILWTRAYSTEGARTDYAIQALALMRAKGMVVGHTVQENGINHIANGRVWRVDTGMSRAFGRRRHVQALEILNDGQRFNIYK